MAEKSDRGDDVRQGLLEVNKSHSKTNGSLARC
jgi:hypothetical protein